MKRSRPHLSPALLHAANRAWHRTSPDRKVADPANDPAEISITDRPLALLRRELRAIAGRNMATGRKAVGNE